MVSSMGRLQSKYGVISYGTAAADGYRVTKIGGPYALVHRLVAQVFLGSPPTEHHCDVHHIDGNRSNNKLTNLMYATRSDNITYSWQRPSRRNSSAYQSLPVMGRIYGMEAWNRFSSMLEAETRTGVRRQCVSACCYGRYQYTNGWEFQFAESGVHNNLIGERWARALNPDTGELLLGCEVSSLGRFRSTRGRISWGIAIAAGYRSVGVGTPAKRLLVHRIIARTFLSDGPPAGRWQINHRDGNRSNNNIENLEYAMPSQNIRHSYRSDGSRRSNRDAVSKPVWGRQCGGERWHWYPSGMAAARVLGILASGVSNCCCGRQRRTRGHEFHFAVPVVSDLLEGEEWRELICPRQ